MGQRSNDEAAAMKDARIKLPKGVSVKHGASFAAEKDDSSLQSPRFNIVALLYIAVYCSMMILSTIPKIQLYTNKLAIHITESTP